MRQRAASLRVYSVVYLQLPVVLAERSFGHACFSEGAVAQFGYMHRPILDGLPLVFGQSALHYCQRC